MVGRRRVREALVAGGFYPGSSAALSAELDRLLAKAQADLRPETPDTRRLIGIIVPHAGYRYSGPIAATGYALLLSRRPTPDRFIILGPSHFVPLVGVAVPTHDAWRTPLGEVVVDEDARRMALAGGAVADDGPHASEHSIEVQLPFLQRICPAATILPMAVGEGAPETAPDLLSDLLSGDDAFLVVSSDLSHYHDARTARHLDERTAEAIEALDATAIGPADACGHQPLRAALRWAGRGGLGIRLLDLRSSADTVGDPGRVVGYGAFGITDGARDVGQPLP